MILMAAVATSFAFGQKVVYGPPVLDPSSQDGQQQQNQPFRQQQKQQRQQRLTFKKSIAQAGLQKTDQDERCPNGRCAEAMCTAKRLVRLLRRRCILIPTGATIKCLDNRCVRYILDKNGCTYEDLPTWIFDPEKRSSKNFPPVCPDGSNFQSSGSHSSAEAQQTRVTQSQRYPTTQRKRSQAPQKHPTSLPYLESPQTQFVPSFGAAPDSAYNSDDLHSITMQNQLSEPLGYSYGMMYPQLPMFFVYMTQPYDLSQEQYKTGGSLEQYSPTIPVASESALLEDLFGDKGLAVISATSTRKFSPPIVSWSSSRRISTDSESPTRRRVTRDGAWQVSEQAVVQSYQPFSASSSGQEGVQAELKSANLAKLAASSLSGVASAALSEAASQQHIQQHLSGGPDATVSSGSFYRESKHELGQAGAANTPVSQQEEQEVTSQSSQEDIVAQSSESAKAPQHSLQEASNESAPSSLYSEQTSGQQSASSATWSGGVRRQKVVAQLGGTKGGTKGMLRAVARSNGWTRNSLGYSG